MKTVVLTSRRLRGLGLSYIQLDEKDPKSKFVVGAEITISEENYKKLDASGLVAIEVKNNNNEGDDS